MSPLLASAARLKHDLGKAIRLNAPDEPERDAAALRERLALDVRATRRAGASVESAVDVYESWRRDDGAEVAAHAACGPIVAEIERAVAAIRSSLPRLDSLSLEELRRLDEATLAVAHGTAALQRAAKEC